jgi:UDP-glucuronate decarboxylase
MPYDCSVDKQIIITGAAGFIGSHLAFHHLAQGDYVVGIDNFVSSNPRSEHLKRLKTHENFVLADCDITNSRTLNHEVSISMIAGKKPDIIYNFACPASPPVYQRLPINTMKTCTMGVINVLDLANKYGSIVVHASTSEVYGEPMESPQKENTRSNVNSYGPRACYDAGKMAAEALCFDYVKDPYNVDVRLVRIFNTYGPHMLSCDGRVISNFISQALSCKPLTIYGDGQQTRSFCYIDDLVAGIVAMGELKQNPLCPVNLGNPNEFTIKQLADSVSSMTSYGSSYVTLPMPIDDPTQRRPDITRAKKLLGWEPKIQLDEGLKRMMDYMLSLVPR